MHSSNLHNSLDYLEQLNRIGIALSRERDTAKLLETILVAAKELLHADGGVGQQLQHVVAVGNAVETVAGCRRET